MIGIRESSLYYSDLRFTKSIQWLSILAVAVYKCLLSSGLNLVTPNPEILSALFFSACCFNSVTNSQPFMLSKAISISFDYLPRTYVNVLHYFVSNPTACYSQYSFQSQLISIFLEHLEYLFLFVSNFDRNLFVHCFQIYI